MKTVYSGGEAEIVEKKSSLLQRCVRFLQKKKQLHLLQR